MDSYLLRNNPKRTRIHCVTEGPYGTLGWMTSRRGKRKMQKIMGYLLLVGFLLIGCVTDRVTEKRGEKEPVSSESSRTDEAWIERAKSLERSVQGLREEVAELRKRMSSLRVRSCLSTYKLPEVVSLCGERVPLENMKVWENLDQEFLVALGNEVQALLWMKRARRYFPHVERRLKEMFLPDDLKYVTITESSLRPHAVSSSGAAGIWQFIPATGERYGMRGGGGIDERFDFFRATEGALAYLKSLYEEFRSWPLAMAAYNAGENKIRKEIAFQRTTDYFSLELSMETERYVYKIAVAKIILSDPARYGFYLEESDLYEPFRLERVPLELSIPLPIMDIAAAIGSSYKEIKEMNLHLSGETIPVGTHFINLPSGTTQKFSDFFAHWKNENGLK